jgi:hypothetical protein
MITKTEMSKIMDILKTAYPRYYINSTKEEVINAINLWCEMFNDVELQTLAVAVKAVIANSEYPPTIADVRKQIYSLCSNDITAMEAWKEAYEMISNGLYMTEEQFNKSSQQVKKFFGSVKQLKELAQVDSDTINTVTKGQFLKQYEILNIREKEKAMLPESIKDRLLSLTVGIGGSK